MSGFPAFGTVLRPMILGLALSLPTLSHAGSLSLQETLGTFNLVTLDYSGTQEVEGRAWIGNTLSNTTGQFGFRAPNDGAGFAELSVDGDLVNSQINLAGGGDRVDISGANVRSRVNNGTLNTGVTTLPDFDFAAFETQSLGIAALPGAAANLSDINNKKFGGGGIVSVAGRDLSGGGYSFDFGSESHLVINVSGTNVTFGMNPLGATVGQASRVVWNFYEATTLQVNSVIAGHVIAPFATASGFSGSTEGTVVARAVRLTNGELHQQGWTGELPGTPPAVIPLPAGLVLLLGGLGSLAVLRRRLA